MRKGIAVDLDGCTRPSHAGRPPIAPPRELGQAFQKLEADYVLAAATGAGLAGALVTEEHLGIAFRFLGVSYCGLCVERNGHVSRSYLVPEGERKTLALITPDLEQIASEFADEVTDREGACFSFHPSSADDFEAACRKVKPLLAGREDWLDFRPTAHDRGIVVVARSASKSLLVNLLQSRSITLEIAAGDGLADLPLLEAATFPIVTLTDEHSAPNPVLVEVVRKKGGYVASDPHAHGLFKGLKAAGVVRV